jgi:hypothetical protein
MGYKQEEILGKSLFQFNHASDGDGIAKSFKSCKALNDVNYLMNFSNN